MKDKSSLAQSMLYEHFTIVVLVVLAVAGTAIVYARSALGNLRDDNDVFWACARLSARIALLHLAGITVVIYGSRLPSL